MSSNQKKFLFFDTTNVYISMQDTHLVPLTKKQIDDSNISEKVVKKLEDSYYSYKSEFESIEPGRLYEKLQDICDIYYDDDDDDNDDDDS